MEKKIIVKRKGRNRAWVSMALSVLRMLRPVQAIGDCLALPACIPVYLSQHTLLYDINDLP